MEDAPKSEGKVPPKAEKAQRMDAWVKQQLEQSFQAAGWEVSRPGSPADPDLLCRRQNESYAVQILASAERARGPVLQALLADAVLRSRAKAAEHGARPLAIIAAPALSDRIVEELRNYMEAFAGGMDWGAIDARGRFQFWGERLRDLSLPEGSPGIGEQLFPKPRPAMNPFSDLGQWMLKVLLAPKLPKQYWLNVHVRPDFPIRSSKDLALEANVSAASASKFLKALEAANFLERRPGQELKLVRIPLLMEAWRSACQGRWQEAPARFLIPGNDSFQQLNDALRNRPLHLNDCEGDEPIDQKLGPKGSRACLGLFAAAESAYAMLVRGAPWHLYVENLSNDLIQELGLIQVEHPSEANLVLRQPNFPESLFRGAVCPNSSKGVASADLIQCWLDVSNHPARGEEQGRMLASMLEMQGWSS